MTEKGINVKMEKLETPLQREKEQVSESIFARTDLEFEEVKT